MIRRVKADDIVLIIVALLFYSLFAYSFIYLRTHTETWTATIFDVAYIEKNGCTYVGSYGNGYRWFKGDWSSQILINHTYIFTYRPSGRHNVYILIDIEEVAEGEATG